MVSSPRTSCAPARKMGGVGLLVHHISKELSSQGHNMFLLQHHQYSTPILSRGRTLWALHILQNEFTMV